MAVSAKSLSAAAQPSPAKEVAYSGHGSATGTKVEAHVPGQPFNVPQFSVKQSVQRSFLLFVGSDSLLLVLSVVEGEAGDPAERDAGKVSSLSCLASLVELARIESPSLADASAQLA
jgi:hypothetical protein